MKKSSLRIIGVVLALLILGSAGWFYYDRSQQAALDITEEITVVTAITKDVNISLAADGKAVSQLTNLKFPTNGVLKEIFVEEGQQIKAGDTLARLATENLQNQVLLATANYNSALAKYDKLVAGPSSAEIQIKQLAVTNAENNLRIEQEAYDYKLELYDEYRITLSDLLVEESKLEGAKAQLDNAKAQLDLLLHNDQYDLDAAAEAVNQTKASLAIAENNLRDATLVTPQAGVIYSINGEIGEYLTTAGTGFIILANENKMTVNAYLIEDDIGKIKAGQLAEVTFTSLQDQVYEGKVVQINPNPIVDQSGIVSYEVSVALNKPDPAIKSGMTATISFIAQQAKDVVTIPVQAVTRIDGAPSVEVQNPDGSNQYVKVKTGLTDGSIVEIKEGLKNGDKVLIRKVIK